MRATLHRLLVDHPASVGETYLEHARHAAGFGAAMSRAALASFLHALVPALCTTTASRTIARLHDHMIVNRAGLSLNRQDALQPPTFLAEHI